MEIVTKMYRVDVFTYLVMGIIKISKIDYGDEIKSNIYTLKWRNKYMACKLYFNKVK